MYRMSQSDYIRHRRVAAELAQQSKLPPVLESGQYTSYKEFSLENTIVSKAPTYNNMVPANVSVVFDMRLPSCASCPQFILCSGTNRRANRSLRGLSPAPPLALKPKHTTIKSLPICSYC